MPHVTWSALISSSPGNRARETLFDAIARDDLAKLSRMLAENVVAHADGGGKKPSHLNPIVGRDKVLRLVGGLAAKPGGTARWIRAVTIDGLPGFIAFDRWGTLQATALSVEDGRIVAFYTVRNPEKLTRLQHLLEGSDRTGSTLD